MASVTVTVRANATFAMAFIRLMRLTSFVIGEDRAYRFAERHVRKLVLIKVEGGRWRFDRG